MVLETWRKYGQVEVSRDERGRFFHWHKIVMEAVGKRVAVYGRCRVMGVESSRRYEFYGRGKELYYAVVLAHRYPPRRRFVTLSAKEFISKPFKYGGEGYWVEEPEVDS